MIVARGETYRLDRYPRLEDSPYEFEKVPDISFFGRPASNVEKRNYRIQQGVDGNSESVYVVCTNLPSNVKPKDRIMFLGKFWSVQSIGFYYEENKVLNGKVFSNDYLVARCPKGLNLQ